MDRDLVQISKFLSLVLRHKPETIGLALDAGGWLDIAALIEGANRVGVALDAALLREMVARNDKRRFAFSADGKRIRAVQGHSVPVDLGLEPRVPPNLLYHGTTTRFLTSIRHQGLLPQERQFVHLSPDAETATLVGQRHGVPVVLVIAAAAMHHDGRLFCLSENGVWLTDAVPVVYIDFPA